MRTSSQTPPLKSALKKTSDTPPLITYPTGNDLMSWRLSASANRMPTRGPTPQTNTEQVKPSKHGTLEREAFYPDEQAFLTQSQRERHKAHKKRVVHFENPQSSPAPTLSTTAQVTHSLDSLSSKRKTGKNEALAPPLPLVRSTSLPIRRIQVAPASGLFPGSPATNEQKENSMLSGNDQQRAADATPLKHEQNNSCLGRCIIS